MCICVSPDAKRILSGGNNRTVRLWDTQSGAELQCFQGHTENVCSVAFLRDGKRLVSGSADGTVRIWDAATGQQLKNLTGHTDAVLYGVAVLPDGKHILSGSHDGTLRIWDIESGNEVLKIALNQAIEGLAVSPDGQRAFCSCRGGTYNCGTWKRAARAWTSGLPLSYQGGRHFARWSARTSVEAGCGTVCLWDLQAGRELRRFDDDSGWTDSVAFSPDGSRVLTGGLCASCLCGTWKRAGASGRSEETTSLRG